MAIVVLLGSLGMSASADFQKGLTAVRSGEFETALRDLRLLSKQGDAAAQCNLGIMYALGKGVLKDYVRTHMWGHIAATNGNKLGAKLRDTFEKKMSPAHIYIAQKLARECVRKKYKGC